LAPLVASDTRVIYVGTTVTMFERVLPSEIASILAIPRASAGTSPELETDTTPQANSAT